MTEPDFIVVGAGSAGCLLANRLAEQRGCRVTLVEAPSTPANPADRQRPARWLNLLGSPDDWDFRTQPEPELASRTLNWPRGRGVGGSSRINSMIWFPPTREDLAHLDTATRGDWSPDLVRRAYSQVEDLVRPEPPRWLSEPSQQFLAAADAVTDGQAMIYQRLNRRGRRWLPEDLIQGSSNIQIVRGLVDHLIWDNGDVVGVRAIVGDQPVDWRAKRGVILCAGAIATPAILMRSGIGAPKQLHELGIALRCSCTEVGRNLRDHLLFPVIFERQPGSSAFPARHSVRDVALWQNLGSGPVASNIAECGGLFRDGAIQLHVTPTHYLSYPVRDQPPSMSIGVNLTQPCSKGMIQLASRDAKQQAIIHANYLSETSDLAGMVEAVHLARTIAALPPLRQSIRSELVPGVKRSGEEAIARSIRRFSQTLYHPVGTCRAGSDANAVVDSRFAVRGVSRLWITDASILPNLSIGNPNALVMTMACLASSVIAQQP